MLLGPNHPHPGKSILSMYTHLLIMRRWILPEEIFASRLLSSFYRAITRRRVFLSLVICIIPFLRHTVIYMTCLVSSRQPVGSSSSSFFYSCIRGVRGRRSPVRVSLVLRGLWGLAGAHTDVTRGGVLNVSAHVRGAHVQGHESRARDMRRSDTSDRVASWRKRTREESAIAHVE